jgi:cysteinyl-tRNA synthetase
VTLRLHDTAARGLREFVPLDPPNVTLYVCGATVKGPPHLGHMRSAVCFDILLRWLQASGFQLTVCRGITDISESILSAAAEQNLSWWQLAEQNIRLFDSSCEALGCLPPNAQPRTSGHVPSMIRLTEQLTATEQTWRNGPKLTCSGDRDVILWQVETEPGWDTPWGTARPHHDLSCCAMSMEYLGTEFDIHGGGQDLRAVHHANERALAKAAGYPFARYWWNNAMLGVPGSSRSRRGGAELTVTEILERVRAEELRYYLAQSHYRSVVEYSDSGLEDAATAYQRIERFVIRARDFLGDDEDGELTPVATELPISFADAMDSDLAVPAALASLHAAVRDGNHALADHDADEVTDSLKLVRTMLAVLGLDPLSPPWRTGERSKRLYAVIQGLVDVALSQREKARERRDFATADSIRESLEKIGVVVEDTSQGPRWELQR